MLRACVACWVCPFSLFCFFGLFRDNGEPVDVLTVARLAARSYADSHRIRVTEVSTQRVFIFRAYYQPGLLRAFRRDNPNFYDAWDTYLRGSGKFEPASVRFSKTGKHNIPESGRRPCLIAPWFTSMLA